MNITKQYDRPNCILTLEGFNENSSAFQDSSVDQSDLISILTNAECIFKTSNQKLKGGRDFLENLAKAVNNYAQEILSGLSHFQEDPQEFPKVQVLSLKESKNYRITLENDPSSELKKQEIELRTTEFFDLLDVIDQFYADSATLPDVSLELEVVSKKLRQSEEPLPQRMIPLVTGTLGLAVVAGLLFALPAPKPSNLEPSSTPIPSENVPAETIPVKPNSEKRSEE